MDILQAGADAPEFELASHKDETFRSADAAGKKNMLVVFYPLDFTPT